MNRFAGAITLAQGCERRVDSMQAGHFVSNRHWQGIAAPDLPSTRGRRLAVPDRPWIRSS